MDKNHDPSMRRRTEEEITGAWRTLLGVVKELPGATSFEQIMAVVCKGARQLSEADGVTLVRRDGDMCHYVGEDAIGPLWKGRRFPMSACIAGWCMLRRQTAVIPEIYTDARIPHDAYRPTFVKSLVMVPVPLDEPVAAIGTYWARQVIPSNRTVMMLEALARATGSAIARVSLP